MREHASNSQWHFVLMHLQSIYNVRLIQAEDKKAPGTIVVWLQGRMFEVAVVMDFVLKALETEVSINVNLPRLCFVVHWWVHWWALSLCHCRILCVHPRIERPVNSSVLMSICNRV